MRLRLAMLLVNFWLLTTAAVPILAQDPQDTAEALKLLDRVRALQKAGKLAEAVKVQEVLVEKVKKLFGPTSPTTANMINNLALLHQSMANYQKAENLLLRGLEIREASLGKDHPDVAQSLNNLAWLYKHLSQYEKAKPLYVRSLEIYEAKLGKDHPDVARSLNNLAALYQDMGQYQKAEPLFLHSLEIREAKLSKDHPDVAQSLNILNAGNSGTFPS